MSKPKKNRRKQPTVNTAYHLEVQPTEDGYVVSYARKEPIESPVSSFLELVPLDEPATAGAAFWFVVPGERLTGREDIFQHFRHAIDPAVVVAACKEAVDWTKQIFEVGLGE